jgi:hypothetical protein
MKCNAYITAVVTVCFAMIACNKGFYPGEYTKVVQNVSYEAFKFNLDSSFEYTYRAGWNKNYSKGKWKLRNGSVILNSQYKRDALPMTVESSQKENTSGYFFKLKKYYSRTDNPNLWQILIVNDRDTFRIEDSIVNIKHPDDLRTFRLEIVTTEYLNDSIGMYRLRTENYTIKSKGENYFLVSYPFDWRMPYQQDFDNESLKIKRKAIYWPAKQQQYNFKKAGS